MSEVKRITIQVANRDRGTELACLLHSLRTQTYKNFDVLILDDASGTRPDSLPFVRSIMERLIVEGHKVEFLRNSVSLGVCKARNKLIDEDPFIHNSHVLRVDDDQVLETDYIERLVKVIEQGYDLASGVTPMLSGPLFIRETRFLGSWMNDIIWNEQGDIVSYGDDCGVLYDESKVLPGKHFRSSVLYDKKITSMGVRYELGLSNVGFREESFFCIRAAIKGFKLGIDTGAIAWHAPCMSGGCRNNNYAQLVGADDQRFKDWFKMKVFYEGRPTAWI